MARRNRKGRHGQYQASLGVIRITKKGFGFVDTPEGEYFVLRSFLRGAMDGDLVEVVRLRSLEARREQQMRRQESQQQRSANTEGRRDMLGAVRRVLERAHETVVGTLHYTEGLGVVCPHDERIGYDIFLDNRATSGKRAQEGDVVVVRITTYPRRLEAASGYITEVVGRQDDKDMGIEVVIREHGFETVFSAGALEEAKALAERGVKAQADDCFRHDLRGRYIFTIDPSDAKDFDDALSLDFIDGQMRLGVHIADVSAYVAWDSAIDLDARRRATSVYLPDRVIPMLPPQLSEDLCSLRPNEDRLAFTVDMLLHTNGSIVASEFYPSIIRSSASLSYDEVTRFFDQESIKEEPAFDALLANKLLALKKLSKKLTRRRLQRGAIEFESVEAKLTLDSNGKPTEVNLRTRTDATALIEEAMILANEQVAAHMQKQGAPMVYRIHEEPFASALEGTLPTLQEFGYGKQGIPQTSHEIQAILKSSEGRPESHLISTLLLRAMKRARYASSFTSHYGLASSGYTHFTSPIRRYPDLMAHRLLTCQLMDDPLPENMLKQLDWICEHSSDMERHAEHASFEATAIKLCEFMEPHIGDRFSAIVTSVNSLGLMVREDSTTAEGFIEREDIPNSLVFDMKRHRYLDPDTATSYRLGQQLQVTLKGIDKSRAKLQFVIA